ncbi:PREDICTED: transcription factor TGA2 [Fragaria vesca subsp. vesca]|uniref:transcription factor TGA2 n=1 Tax=Fragaria vesca subsp. vesca TaxID=101020 RepID=UPI0002C3363A|nr:PREDICTED: transcription factor TGA2 [Fragaria vesca subsp. vesca]
MTTQVEERFTEFFETWVCQLEQLQHQLLKLSQEKSTLQPHNEAELQALVSRVTNLHKEYYTAKWAAAHQDVLAFFCPVWSSPLENAYSWLTGWKPSMLFKLMRKARLQNLSEQQLRKIEELRLKIRYEEERVEREMERQQVAMADRKMVELARLATRVRNGGGAVVEVEGMVDMAMKVILNGLERVMKAADCVRLKALKGLLDLLSPLQCVEFLAATGMVQIRLSQWGRKRSNVLIDLN